MQEASDQASLVGFQHGGDELISGLDLTGRNCNHICFNGLLRSENTLGLMRFQSNLKNLENFVLS